MLCKSYIAESAECTTRSVVGMQRPGLNRNQSLLLKCPRGVVVVVVLSRTCLSRTVTAGYSGNVAVGGARRSQLSPGNVLFGRLPAPVSGTIPARVRRSQSYNRPLSVCPPFHVEIFTASTFQRVVPSPSLFAPVSPAVRQQRSVTPPVTARIPCLCVVHEQEVNSPTHLPSPSLFHTAACVLGR